jgi:ribulose-phosphate 3-epimerase
VEAVEPLLGDLEYVMLLAVNPGWSGQAFIASTADRIGRARELVASSGRDVLLGVDGGVTRANIASIAALGVDVIVTGSAVFDGKAPEDNARTMLGLVRETDNRA